MSETTELTKDEQSLINKLEEEEEEKTLLKTLAVNSTKALFV